MGKKENFNQAMHEVFPFYKNAKSSVAGAEANTSALARQIGSETISSALVKQTETEANFSDLAELTNAIADSSDFSELSEPDPIKKALDFKSFYAAIKQESIEVETTSITKDTKITGTIVSKSNLDISGDIFGDVESSYRVKISGKVEGNISGNDVEINSATIKGNILATEKLCIMNRSTIVGNISANELDFNGKINGNITVKKEITIQKDSNIVGDVTAMTIGIEKGASIKGMVTILGERKSFDEDILL